SAGVPDPGAGGAPDAGAGGEPEPGSGGVPSEAGSDAGGAAGEIGMAGAGGAIDAGGAAGAGGGPEPVEGIHIYVGCDSSSGNIRSFAFDRDVGEMTPLGSINVGSPLSAAVLHPDEDWLYVSHATQGRITTFARDPVTGSLDEQDSVTVPYDPALGAGGAGGEDDNPETRALAVDSTGSYLAAANTAADTVVAFELDDDGLIGALAGFDSAGTAPRDVLFNRTDEFVVVPYSGSDEVVVHAFDAGDLDTEVEVSQPADSGPNAAAMHQNGDWLYVLNETEGSVSFFAFDENSGELDLVDTYEVPPPAEFAGTERNSSAIGIGPNGKFLYVTSQLDSEANGTLATFAISVSNGELELIDPNGVVDSRGVGPSSFAISEDGTLLVLANEESNTIAAFSLNSATGAPVFIETRTVCAGPQFVVLANP